MDSNQNVSVVPSAARCARAAIDGVPVEELSRGFLVLGNPIRLAILLAVSGRELCVADLVRLFNVTQGAVSQHLRRLRQQGLVTTRRTHKNVFYRLHEECATALLMDGLRALADARTIVAAEESGASPDGNSG